MSILSVTPRTTILEDLEKLFLTGQNKRLYTSIAKRLATASRKELYTSIGFLLFAPGMDGIRPNGRKRSSLLLLRRRRLYIRVVTLLMERNRQKRKT